MSDRKQSEFMENKYLSSSDGSLFDDSDDLLVEDDSNIKINLLLDSESSDVCGKDTEEIKNCKNVEKLEALKARDKETKEELEKLEMIQYETSKILTPISSPALSPTEKKDMDDRSLYVGNVEYSATAAELEAHFAGCGSVNRVTILCNKSDGSPKGYAYIEFKDKESIETALLMNETLFKDRFIKVLPKRTNMPGMCATNRISRGFRGRVSRGMHHGRGRGATTSFVVRGRGCGATVYRGRNYGAIAYRGRGNYYTPY